MNYSDVKEAQEKSIIDDFINWMNEDGNEFVVLDRPDPPDAIVRDVSSKDEFWIEVSSSYHSNNWAVDLNSFADPNREHVVMAPGPYMNMDKHVAENFADTLRGKLSKKSYKESYEKYGPGVLVIKIYSPWRVDGLTFELMEEACEDIENETGYFNKVYVYCNHSEFYEWEID